MEIDRVSFVSISDKLGGAEQLILKLVLHCLKEGKAVDLYFFKKREEIGWEVPESDKCNLKIHSANGSFLAFIQQLRSVNHQVIFSSHLMINAILGFLRLTKLLLTDLLICRESTSVFHRYKGLKLWSYKTAYFVGYWNIDLVICQTTPMKQVLIENAQFLVRRTKIVVNPNPFVYPERVPSLNIDYPFIVAAGRLIEEKGFDVLIQSFKTLKERYPKYKLIILGEGGLRKKLALQIEAQNMKSDVVLAGQVENVYPYFKQAELCVVSSIREGFPNVLLQMMSQNSNVVSTLCAGDIEQIEGLVLSPVNNVEALTNAMLMGIQQDSSINRIKFADELKARSLLSFIKKICYEINY